jgi:hypothetical protein
MAEKNENAEALAPIFKGVHMAENAEKAEALAQFGAE